MKYFWLISSLFLCSILSAQNIKITGTVSDSLGNPLGLANIIATKKADDNVVSYAIANDGGNYRISLPKASNYILTASFLGMKPSKKEVEILANSEDMTIDFVLLQNKNQLEGVELVYEIPVIVRGDTIVYDTGSFTNGTEKKLGDVLKKLPGFEVTKEGDVKVQGKKVSKVLVEGKEFYSGNMRLASKNIPADALSKVEVLRNYNEVQQMSGLKNDHENVALNIKLKEGKKNFWFGEVEGAVGTSGKTHYLGSTRLFYYSPKTSANIIGNTNNLGDVPFTFMDYFQFMGGLDNFGSGGSSFDLSNGGLGFLLAQDERANKQETVFGAANFTYKASKKWDVSGFAIFGDNKTDFVKHSLRQYVETQTTEKQQSSSEIHNQLGMFKFHTVFKPNKRFQLNYDALLKKSNFEKFGNSIFAFYDETDEVINPVIENRTNPLISFQQNLNLYYTLNRNNIFAGYFQFLHKEENPFYNAFLKLKPFPWIFPLEESQIGFDIYQESFMKTNKIDGKLDYYYVLNDKSHFNLSLGTTYAQQNFNSSIFQLLGSGEINDFEGNEFNNTVTYDFTDLYLGLHYKILAGIFTFTPGATLHNYSTKTKQFENSTRKNQTLLLPDFFAVAQFGQTESLRFDYRMKANFMDIQKLATAYVFQNYNNLFRGNKNLENELSHHISLRYSDFNMFNFTNMSFSVNYIKKMDAVLNATFMQETDWVSTAENSDFPREQLKIGGSFQKTFRKIVLNLDANASLKQYSTIVNQEKQGVENFGQTYEIGVQSNFDNSPNLEIGYKQDIDKYENGNIEKVYYTGKLFLKAQINFFQNFNFSADFNYFNYSDKEKTLTNKYSFLDAELNYQNPDSHWKFSLKASNLLNVKSLDTNGMTENSSFTSNYLVQPRILLLSVKYDL